MKKRLKVITVSTALALLGSIQVFAATSRIGTVSIGFTETKEEAGVIREAEPTTRGGGYEITDWSCSHDYSSWTPGNKVTFTIEVEPTGDNHFSTDETRIRLSGKNAELSSQKVRPSRIEMKVNYWPSMTLGTPENLVWDDDDEYVATWDEVEYCDLYEVKIFLENWDGKTKSKTVTTKRPEIDLSEYATDGDVTFHVRSVPKDDKQKKYYTASPWVDMNDSVTISEDNTVSGIFDQTKDGEKVLTMEDGKKASGWQRINNVWYYFDPADGNRAATNRWALINNSWYYFGEDSSMASGWVYVNGFWYYMNNQYDTADYGKMQVGWIQPGPAEWFYLNDGAVTDIPYGACLINRTTPDGYKVNERGAWLPN